MSSSGKGDGALDGLVSQLQLDEGRGASRLELKLAGRRVHVATEHRDRQNLQLEGVRLSVEFERAPGTADAGSQSPDSGPRIVLRREHEDDVTDKDRGLTREVQTGFAGFDHAVFIDNDSSEADVLRVLATEATRQAVLRLLEAGHHAVLITSSRVTVRHPVNDGVVRAGPVMDALEDLLIVARAGGPKESAPSRRGELLTLIGCGVSAAAGCYGWLTWSAWPTSLGIGSLGVIAGAIVAFFSRPTVEAACSGDSASARRAATLLGLCWFTSAALVFGGVVHLNGALDDSEGEVWHGVLTSTGARRRPFSFDPVGVRWSDGSTSIINGDSFMRAGDRITERRHPGAFGFGWFEGRRITSR